MHMVDIFLQLSIFLLQKSGILCIPPRIPIILFFPFMSQTELVDSITDSARIIRNI